MKHLKFQGKELEIKKNEFNQENLKKIFIIYLFTYLFIYFIIMFQPNHIKNLIILWTNFRNSGFCIRVKMVFLDKLVL